MKIRSLLPLLVSIILILILVATSCTPATTQPTATGAQPTVTVTATPKAAAADKSYRVLNPVGDLPSVNLITMPPRIDKLEGKTIAFIQAEADPIVMPALWERVQKDYPTVKWVTSFTSTTSPIKLTAEQLVGVQAAIIGVAW